MNRPGGSAHGAPGKQRRHERAERNQELAA
jgi:hypothetical protein